MPALAWILHAFPPPSGRRVVGCALVRWGGSSDMIYDGRESKAREARREMDSGLLCTGHAPSSPNDARFAQQSCHATMIPVAHRNSQPDPGPLLKCCATYP